MCQCELEVVGDKTTISRLWLQCLSYVNAMVGARWTEAAVTWSLSWRAQMAGSGGSEWMIISGFAATENRL
jgi:hypothetical protein